MQDLGRGEHPVPGGHEFDGQRKAVQPAADPPRLAVFDRARLEARAHEPGAVGEQRERGLLVQGRHPEGAFPGDAQRDPAGGQDPQSRAAEQQLVHQRGDGGGEVFAVVEDEHRVGVRERLDESLGLRRPGLLGDVQRGGRRARDGVGVGDRCQGHEPPVADDLAGEAGLPRSRRTHQRDQA
ncbi:hypothetical protein EIL87_00720 [Saccharopolyspora rhizosphaerae]|uniref:Uncharacterized protein n=1 Tax=Saccharopolyspora rhizosphaerae TaxID=2492662 RepID=A0A426K4X3_9PSEU|nr:hypothetical protein [Saccharopolyspora rhizosphaerae]RRO20457.1 hypothetical protein EIL87_00720 [Saccharopolyspora rhizosphaerae]